MTNQIKPAVFNFNSHEVRTVYKNSVAWFVASDIAKVLEYRNASDLTRVLDGDERDTHNMRTPSGDQDMLIINESGLYHALFKSRKKEAQAFRKWVTNEVLPAIRKTGSYTAENTKTSKSTADDRTPLRDAINLLVSKKHILYPEAYSYVHQRFNVKHIDELEPSMLPVAVEYVHKLALVGELLEAEQPESKKDISFDKLIPFSFSKRYLVRVFVSDNVMKTKVFFTGESDTFNDMATGICKTLGFLPVEFKSYPINHNHIHVLQ